MQKHLHDISVYNYLLADQTVRLSNLDVDNKQHVTRAIEFTTIHLSFNAI